MADQDFVAMTRKRVQQARDSWERFLTQTGLPHTRSQTNFQFFQAPKMQASALKKRLLQQGFLVRDVLKPGWLRVTFGTEVQNTAVQRIIETFQAELTGPNALK